MTLALTPLQSDNFNRSNVSPLTSPWALDEYGDPGLQIVSDFCEAATGSGGYGIEIFTYAGGLPNDQYASFTLKTLGFACEIVALVRATDSGAQWNYGAFNGYYLTISNGGSWALSKKSTQLLNGSATINTGDVFTIAAVGTTIYAYQNEALLGSIADTTYASGVAMLAPGYLGATNTAVVSNFTIGRAAVASGDPYSGTIPFLGSVRVIGNAPAGAANPFIGTIKVLASAPAGEANPYLGSVTVGTPSSGDGNPVLGQVVIVTSVPAGDTDEYLGQIEEG